MSSQRYILHFCIPPESPKSRISVPVATLAAATPHAGPSAPHAALRALAGQVPPRAAVMLRAIPSVPRAAVRSVDLFPSGVNATPRAASPSARPAASGGVGQVPPSAAATFRATMSAYPAAVAWVARVWSPPALLQRPTTSQAHPPYRNGARVSFHPAPSRRPSLFYARAQVCSRGLFLPYLALPPLCSQVLYRTCNRSRLGAPVCQSVPVLLGRTMFFLARPPLLRATPIRCTTTAALPRACLQMSFMSIADPFSHANC